MCGRVGRSGKTGVDLLHAPVAAEDKGCRPAVEVVALRDFFVKLVRGSGDQDGIGESVALNEGAKAGGVLELIFLFEAKVYDLKPFAVELLVEALEEGGLVMAVGAPG